MKSGITRWKMVPSYRRLVLFLPLSGCCHSRLPSARSTKLATVLGASFSNRRQTTVPSEVLKTAYVPGWRVIGFLSAEMSLFRRRALPGPQCWSRQALPQGFVHCEVAAFDVPADGFLDVGV